MHATRCADHDVRMLRLSEETRARLERAILEPRTRKELLALGLRPHDIRRLHHTAALHRHRGRYVGAHLRADLARAACTQAAYPGSAVSHLTAAALTGLRTWVDGARPDAPPVDAVWLTRPPGQGRVEYEPDLVVRIAALDASDICRLNRLTTTHRARTVVDLARELPMAEAVVTLDHALAVYVTRAEIAAVLGRQSGWPGIARARAAVEFADPRSGSALESIARVAFADQGLPRPVLQASFWSGSGWTPERVDFYWPQYRTFAEADGLAKYEAESPAERRQLMRAAFHREQRLADLGLEMVRFGWEDAVNDAPRLAERLTDAFARGAERPGDPPDWYSDDPHDLTLWPAVPPPDTDR